MKRRPLVQYPDNRAYMIAAYVIVAVVVVAYAVSLYFRVKKDS